MPFHRRSNLRPVHSIKHVIDIQAGLALGTTETQNLASAVDDPVLSDVDEVQTGCSINSIYLTLEALATSSSALSNFYMILWKNPGGNLSVPAPNTVGSSNNKRFVIHQEMIMFQLQTGSNPRNVFKGVLSLPKGFRRFGPNDKLNLTVLAPGVNVNYCLQCIYKEYR